MDTLVTLDVMDALASLDELVALEALGRHGCHGWLRFSTPAPFVSLNLPDNTVQSVSGQVCTAEGLGAVIEVPGDP